MMVNRIFPYVLFNVYLHVYMLFMYEYMHVTTVSRMFACLCMYVVMYYVCVLFVHMRLCKCICV